MTQLTLKPQEDTQWLGLHDAKRLLTQVTQEGCTTRDSLHEAQLSPLTGLCTPDLTQSN